MYRSKAGAAEEARHVFVDGNMLASRFASCAGVFSVAELGFGTGLNFIATWDCWRKNASKNSRLHYHSWEAYPLDHRQWKQVHQAWPETVELARRLGKMLPLLWPGWHNVEVEPGVTLTLAYEDVTKMPDAGLKADAWFLDGFSPAANPAMWTQEVMDAVARMTASGGTVATYSSAGHVREKLAKAGFEVREKEGFGNKRTMTVAQKPGSKTLHQNGLGKVAVVGAGIAGASVVRELARRNITAQVFDHVGPEAKTASSNPAAMLSARLSGNDSSLSALAVQSFSHSLRLAGELGLGNECGMLSLRREGREASRQEALMNNPPPADLARTVDVEEAGSIAGVSLGVPGLFVPKAMLVDGAGLVATMLGYIKVVGKKVTKIDCDKAKGWTLRCEPDEVFHFDHVFLAASHGCDDLLDGRFGFGRRDGNLNVVAATKQSDKLQVALQYGGCMTPANADGTHMVTGLDLVPEQVKKLLDFDGAKRTWGASRCTTGDRHAVAGSLGGNLHVLAGLGSRGMTHAPLLAAHIVSRVLAEPPWLPRRLQRAVSPNQDRRHW